MRIYLNCKEAWSEILRDLFEMGTWVESQTVQDKIVEGLPEFRTRELIGYTYTIEDPSDWEKVLKKENLSVIWTIKEFLERISSWDINPGEAWKLREAIWSEFIHGEVFSYTYNNRIRTQLSKVIKELKIHEGTRQGIISIWNPVIDVEKLGRERVPCSIMYNFMVREGKLNLIYVMRSCDLLTHFLYDVALAVLFQKHIANEIGKEIGTFTHFIFSLHAFQKDLKKRGIF